MNLTYLRLELRRILRDVASLFFIVVLPAFLYIIFGASQEYGGEMIVGGNVTMYIMTSMAAYAAVTASTGVGGIVAIERVQGWGRQLGLTPMSDSQYVGVKMTVAFLISLVPIGSIYLIGRLTGAEGTAQAWWVSALVVVGGSLVFALYGLAAGLAFSSEAAVSAASGLLVILAFLGNVFFPLSGAMLTIAKFTPLYGYIALARYPITDGLLISSDGGTQGQEALWVPLLNLGAWAAIFAVAAVLLVRRGRERQ
ncbi:MAG TPA: ABC transporter permease [Actinomycetales bacterium]|nr:ABC transporter permease [Actinomycetales bacterium]